MLKYNIRLRKKVNNNGFLIVIITLNITCDTAGHYQAISDQVNIHGTQAGTAPQKKTSLVAKLQGSHEDSSIKNNLKYEVSAIEVITFDLHVPCAQQCCK